MAVTEQDVRHIAALARLGLDEARVPSLVGELNTILEHMGVLEKVDTKGVDLASGVGSGGTPLREDLGPPIPLAVRQEAFSPAVRDGFFLVPRLSTHEGLGDGDDSVMDDHEGKAQLAGALQQGLPEHPGGDHS
jgi:aspartyl-tRNA(Asn)/glutamyl-tRNA(Gln) amidotransferase subunit C